MFENIIKFFKKFSKEAKVDSKDTAKERLHLVLMQDRANVSTDFLEMMKQEIIEVIKKYIDVDENSIDVKLTNKTNTDGTTGAPMLYANIPITSIKNDSKKIVMATKKDEEKVEDDEGIVVSENKDESAKNAVSKNDDIDEEKSKTFEENEKQEVDNNTQEVNDEEISDTVEDEVSEEEVKEEKTPISETAEEQVEESKSV